MNLELVVAGETYQVHLEPGEEEGRVRATVNGEPFDLHLTHEDLATTRVQLDGTEHEIQRQGRVLHVDGQRMDVAVAHLAQAAAGAGLGTGGEVTPPMPGRILEILVEEGDQVSEGQPLVILEAMKMQNEIQAEGDGVVKEVRVAEGDTVEASDVLLVLEPS